MDLTVSGSAAWDTAANGVLMSGGKIGTEGAAQKLIDALKASNQSTFEIWIAPANLINNGGPVLGHEPATTSGAVLGSEFAE